MRRRAVFVGAGSAVLAGLAGCAGDSVVSGGPTATPTSDSTTHAIEIDYAHEWAGRLELTRDSDPHAVESLDGAGPTTIDLPADATHVDVRVRKTGTPEGTLALRVLEDGEVHREIEEGPGWVETGLDVSLD